MRPRWNNPPGIPTSPERIALWAADSIHHYGEANPNG